MTRVRPLLVGAVLASLTASAAPDGGVDHNDAPLTLTTLDANGNLGAFVVDQSGQTFVCEPEPLAITLAQRLVSLTTERDELRAKVLSEDPGWLRLTLVGLGALLLGAAFTFGVLDATGHFR